jgi:hypothetical protein
MTATEQRVALAEWLGWSCIEDAGGPLMMPDGIVLRGYPPEGAVVGKKLELPDFLNDLNVVHEVLMKLPSDGSWAVYKRALLRTCNFDAENDTVCWMITHNATASQRCEALLRCLGLWKDKTPPQPAP